MDKPRVALVLNGMTFTGAPKVAYDVFSRLESRLRLQIIALHGGLMTQRFRQIAPVSMLPTQRFADCMKTDGLRAGLPAFVARPFTRARIALSRPDVVYVNGVWALPALNHMGIGDANVVVHVHETDRYLRQICRDYPELLLNRPTRYIAVSNATKDSVVGFGVKADRVDVIYNALPPGTARADVQADRTDNKFIVGGSGNLAWYKGTQLWVQMAAEVTRIVGEDAVRFVWLGSDDSGAALEFEETARKLKVWHLIDFLPTTKDPLEVFKTFDVLAVSSWEETFSLVSLECMSLGKVVVCFADNGGTPEVIGDTGICVPGFSPQLMAQSIVDLMRNPDGLSLLGVAARERAATQFKLDTQVEAVYNVIARACAEKLAMLPGSGSH